MGGGPRVRASRRQQPRSRRPRAPLRPSRPRPRSRRRRRSTVSRRRPRPLRRRSMRRVLTGLPARMSRGRRPNPTLQQGRTRHWPDRRRSMLSHRPRHRRQRRTRVSRRRRPRRNRVHSRGRRRPNRSRRLCATRSRRLRRTRRRRQGRTGNRELRLPRGGPRTIRHRARARPNTPPRSDRWRAAPRGVERRPVRRRPRHPGATTSTSTS